MTFINTDTYKEECLGLCNDCDHGYGPCCGGINCKCFGPSLKIELTDLAKFLQCEVLPKINEIERAVTALLAANEKSENDTVIRCSRINIGNKS
jgi:hypothetical protein